MGRIFEGEEAQGRKGEPDAKRFIHFYNPKVHANT